MKPKAPQSQARLFGRAGESVTRGDRRERELEFQSPFPPLTARPNKRRDDNFGLTTESSPIGGAPIEHSNSGKTLTPVGHPFMTPSERRFAPTTVRQARNGVRYGLEQVSAFIGIRSGPRRPVGAICWRTGHLPQFSLFHNPCQRKLQLAAKLVPCHCVPGNHFEGDHLPGWHISFAGVVLSHLTRSREPGIVKGSVLHVAIFQLRCCCRVTYFIPTLAFAAIASSL
jgi:hypothetical protein